MQDAAHMVQKFEACILLMGVLNGVVSVFVLCMFLYIEKTIRRATRLHKWQNKGPHKIHKIFLVVFCVIYCLQCLTAIVYAAFDLNTIVQYAKEDLNKRDFDYLSHEHGFYPVKDTSLCLAVCLDYLIVIMFFSLFLHWQIHA